MSASSSSSGVELARQELLRAYQWNDTMLALRPIIADIDGTETERRFFHELRHAESNGLAAHVLHARDFVRRYTDGCFGKRNPALQHIIVACNVRR